MLDPGQTLGRYRVENQLGAGGMGEVYRAWDATLRRWVALKVVLQGDGSGRAERLLGEARAAAALHHPNIVSVFDVGEDSGYAFVSMDLVEGQPLRDYIGDMSIPQDKQLAWLIQIASALRAAHKAGLVHRDIKPDNVMITVDGEARVLDFGLAKTFSVDVQAPTAHDDALRGPSSFRTGEGRVIGTPAYMAPEQLAGGPASPSWDQYAWGILGCELLTGQHPRVAGLISVSGWVKAESFAKVSPAVAQVISRAMAPSPDQRFASMEAIIVALGAPVSGGLPVPAGSNNPPPNDVSTSLPAVIPIPQQIGDTLPVPVHPNAPLPQPRPRRPIAGWVVGGIAIAATAAGLTWWRSHPTAAPLAGPSTPTTSAPTASAPHVETSAGAVLPLAASAALSAASSASPPSAASTAAPAPTHATAPPVAKLKVTLTTVENLQYPASRTEPFVRGLKPAVQACVAQHPVRSLPAALVVDLELWSIGANEGTVRDVRVDESPPLASCLRDVFSGLSFGPPKSANIPAGGVFVRIHVDRE